MSRSARFVQDSRGNVAITFALLLTVLFGVAGLAVDYAVAVHRKRSMDSAMDLALLAGSNAGADALRAGKPDWASIGKQAATSMFRANLPAQTNYEALGFKADYTKVGGQLTGSATYEGRSFTTFMKLFNINSVPLKGEAAAVTGLPNFIDIHFVVDVSSSMGIGATQADQDKMYAGTACAFACHQGFGVNDKSFTPERMRSLGATLRVDLVRKAILNAIDRVKANSLVSANVRIGIYTVSEVMTVLSAPDTDLVAVRARAASIDLTTGNNGGSYLSKGLEDVNLRLGQGGTGSSDTDRLSFVVFMSDGVDDTSTVRYTGQSSGLINTKLPGWRTTTPSGQPGGQAWLQAFSPKPCQDMTAKGHKVVAVQIKYVAATGFNVNPVDGRKVNYIRDTLRTPLVTAFQTCGVEGYKEAANSTDIDPVLRQIVDEVILPKISRLSE